MGATNLGLDGDVASVRFACPTYFIDIAAYLGHLGNSPSPHLPIRRLGPDYSKRLTECLVAPIIVDGADNTIRGGSRPDRRFLHA